MAVAILAPNRIQDQQDFGSTPGAGNDGYSITWNNSTSRFVLTNVSGGGGSVSSVFGRTGAVVATTGDYTASQVTNAAAVNAANTFTMLQTASANIALNNATSNTVFFGNTGVAAPGTGSAGEKIQFYGTSGTVGSGDYAMGIEDSHLWFNGIGYKWYRNSTLVARMNGTGFIYGTGTPSAAIDSGTGRFTGGANSGTYRTYLDMSGDSGIPAVDFIFSAGKFRVASASVKGTNDIFFQALPSTSSGYGFLEAWDSAGLVLGTGSNTSPVIFQVNRTEIARVDSVGFGIGVSPSVKLHALINDAVTNAITNIQILGHNTTGTPAAGFGAGLKFTLESSTTADQDAARLVALWDVATHASRSAALKILISNTAEVDAAQFDDDATAGNTRFLVYDVDNGQLERVSVGAADSGGVGFKVLRIAN